MIYRKKVLLLGGSFDPIHDGHLAIMKTAIKQERASEGWFVLAQQAPLKTMEQLSFEQRANMIKQMISPYRKLKLCTIEKDLPLPNYTINTIQALQAMYSDIEFVFLMGSDQAENFTAWKDYKILLEKIKFLVYPRSEKRAIDSELFTPLEAPLMDVSSTAIRQGLSVATSPKILSTMILQGYYTREMLPQFVDQDRMDHSLRVAKLAKELAILHQIDPVKAHSAGLIHDLFKQKSTEEMIPYLTSAQQKKPAYLHHGYALAQYLAKVYYIRDKAFLKAIFHHVGGNGTGKLAQILFIADKAEAGRPYETSGYRQLAKQNLTQAVKQIRQDIATYERNK